MCAELTLRALSQVEIRRYVEREQPIHSAGSYLSESLGVVLFESLRSDDPTAIVGLPLVAVARLLRMFGLAPLAEPWA